MKIFGIGEPKTGTLSLHRALQILGYRSVHYAPTIKGREGWHEAAERILEAEISSVAGIVWMNHYDAILDFRTLRRHWRVFDEQYPGSKFIYTTRDMTNWLDSNKRHIARNVKLKAKGKYSGGNVTFDPQKLQDDRTTRWAEIATHFQDRPQDYLVIDICAGEGWEKLCEFLEKPMPDVPFPHETHSSS